MIKGLKSVFGSSKPSQPAAEQAASVDAPRPEKPSYLVGDIHGRADLLEQMLEKIDAHIGAIRATDPQLVFLGDYIDFGPDSLEVLKRLHELSTSFPENVTCLMGNHERMLLDTLENPATRGPRWLRSGGVETLRSLGLDPVSDGEQSDGLANALARALPDGVADWLAQLPLTWVSGNLCATHAGADPYRSLETQSARILLWGHPELESRARVDGNWIAYGHHRVTIPYLGEGRVALNTGAHETGKLVACACLPDGHFDFLMT